MAIDIELDHRGIVVGAEFGQVPGPGTAYYKGIGFIDSGANITEPNAIGICANQSEREEFFSPFVEIINLGIFRRGIFYPFQAIFYFAVIHRISKDISIANANRGREPSNSSRAI
jgi:hypothetical protein